MSRRIDATIQARLGSSRLPGKVLLPVAGRPLLSHIIDRIRQSRLIDRMIVATSTSPVDDAVENLAKVMGAECYRGSENDVLGRVVGALTAFDVDVHVEFQGDNAVPDGMLIDSVIGYYLKHQDEVDYVTTGLKTTFPPGSEFAVYPRSVMVEAERDWQPANPREHVGIHVYRRPEKFRSVNLEAPAELHGPDLHLEVDTEEDYKVICRLFEHFLPERPGFSLAEAITFVRQTGLCDNNRDVPRRWAAFRQDDDGAH